MTTLDKAIIADMKVNGVNFEVYVDPELANMYREGRKPDVRNILVVDEIYSDAKKAEKAKSEALQKAFGTTDMMRILEIILKKGSIQLTTEQKRKKMEERHKQVVSILVRETIDPRTNAPHTAGRIEEALEKAKVHVDPFRDARDQLPDILKEIRAIIPLKFERMRVAVKIPAQFAHQSYGALKSWGIVKEEWAKDGSLIVLVEIPSGAQGEFYDRVNKLTAGNNETRVVEKIG